MDKKTIVALFLTIVVIFFFQMYFAPKEEPVKQPTGESTPKAEAQQKPQAQQVPPTTGQQAPDAATQSVPEKQAKKDVERLSGEAIKILDEFEGEHTFLHDLFFYLINRDH